MVFDILTLFPQICREYCDASILGRAQKAGLIKVRATDIREFATDKHRSVDDLPYGGGDGMVMMAGPLMGALDSLPKEPRPRVILLTPTGRPFDQAAARELVKLPRLVLVCGRYEGIDQRFIDLAVQDELSLGDFVISGGELAALCVVDAISRLIPGVLGGASSAQEDSFMHGLLEHPHYTRPAEFEGREVPQVLLSGHHAQIERWRRKESLRRTKKRRPDLLARAGLGPEDLALLDEITDEESMG